MKADGLHSEQQKRVVDLAENIIGFLCTLHWYHYSHTHRAPPTLLSLYIFLTHHPLIGLMPYQPMTPIPIKALKQLNTNATIPLAVKPSGNLPGLLFSPVRSE